MIVYLICYLSSFLFARISQYALSGIALLLAALFLYYKDYKRTKSLFNLRGLFSISFVGGQALSCLKLSLLQSDWAMLTWACFFIAYLCFWLSYEILYIRNRNYSNIKFNFKNNLRGDYNYLFISILVVTALSLVAFLFEAFKLGFIPLLLKGVPHAYSSFHITGVHYFTVSCVLVPALAVIYYNVEKTNNIKKLVIVLIAVIISLSIPILCVSRFQFLFAVIVAALTFAVIHIRSSVIYGLAVFALIIPIYILLTVARSHNVEYLNSIFEIKNHLPIFISQPYIYIANNYDNFNSLVEFLPKHSWGLKSMFPLWALSGLKFLFPALVDFPIYVTKTELTTVTLFYDAYYDFGIVGVAFLSAILGSIAYYADNKLKSIQNPIEYLFYAQFALYLSLSFFTTWFSNPTTWFYLFVTAAIYLICNRKN